MPRKRMQMGRLIITPISKASSKMHQTLTSAPKSVNGWRKKSCFPFLARTRQVCSTPKTNWRSRASHSRLHASTNHSTRCNSKRVELKALRPPGARRCSSDSYQGRHSKLRQVLEAIMVAQRSSQRSSSSKRRSCWTRRRPRSAV